MNFVDIPMWEVPMERSFLSECKSPFNCFQLGTFFFFRDLTRAWMSDQEKVLCTHVNS